MSVTVVVGGQWGDEGKGKITDILAADADLVVRYQGGSNAGHTVIVQAEEFKLHLIPSGILREDCICLMGGGTVIDPLVLTEEIGNLQARGYSCDNLRVSYTAHVVMPYHKHIEKLAEQARGRDSIGTTLRGIGPAYTDKTRRMPRPVRFRDLSDANQLRKLIEDQLTEKNIIVQHKYGQPPLSAEQVFEEIWPAAQKVSSYAVDGQRLVQDALLGERRIVFEGAQGTFLDLDCGTYPFVTSSHPVAAGACLGTGLGPTAIDEVIMVCKAYTTRVGAGVLPTEDEGEGGQLLRDRGQEYGTTTGRPRRCGWLDGVVVRTAAVLNGATCLAITKLDVLDELATIPVCIGYEIDGVMLDTMPSWPDDLEKVRPVYEELPGWQQPLGQIKAREDLPAAAQEYVERIEELAAVPAKFISAAPSREQTIHIQ